MENYRLYFNERIINVFMTTLNSNTLDADVIYYNKTPNPS